MKKIIYLLLIISSLFVIISCSSTKLNNNQNNKKEEQNKNNSHEVVKSMKALIDGKEYIINLEDNETAKKFVDKLPQELKMTELNGNEKYVNLDYNLPEKSYYPKQINAGDVMLFGDNCLVIFYKSFNSDFSYTKIGHIDNLPDLGSGNITVKFKK